MAYEIERALARLDQEMKKDQEQTDRAKQKLIEEIRSYDRTKMFAPPTKKKNSFLKKIATIFGYGKKG